MKKTKLSAREELMKLSAYLTRREEGLSEASIGDVRQVMKLLAEEELSDPGSVSGLIVRAAGELQAERVKAHLQHQARLVKEEIAEAVEKERSHWMKKFKAISPENIRAKFRKGRKK